MTRIRAPSERDLDFALGAQWRSDSGYVFQFNADGGLEVRHPRGHKLWECETPGRNGKKLSVQADGNVVIYDVAFRRAVWSTNTAGHPGAYLAVQDDGNVVVYSKDRKPLWSTGTAGE